MLEFQVDELARLQEEAVSITVEQSDFSLPCSNEFFTIRDSGPHIPQILNISVLSLFELYFNPVAIDRIRISTLAYAEAKK